jgi:hypothetical protein
VFAKWRDELKPFAARLANTNQGVALTKKRAFACADWAVREITPLALEKRHPESAAHLRAVPEIVDELTALAAHTVAQAAASAAAYAAYVAADAGDRPVWDAALAFLGRLCDMSGKALSNDGYEDDENDLDMEAVDDVELDGFGAVETKSPAGDAT